MKDFTLKLINSTLENLQEFAKNSRKKSEEWKKVGVSDLAEYYEGKAKSFELAHGWIKDDIEIGHAFELDKKCSTYGKLGDLKMSKELKLLKAVETQAEILRIIKEKDILIKGILQYEDYADYCLFISGVESLLDVDEYIKCGMLTEQEFNLIWELFQDETSK